jgi:6-phosphogluconolactonase (cycloisomerase 2 family)
MSVSSRLRTRWFLGPIVACLGAVGMVALPGAALAHGFGSPVIGHVYTDGNNAGANTVAVFDRHIDGSLTANPGSPYPAGGVGLGTGLGSQGAVQTADGGRYVLAADAGSNQISVLRAGWNGSLTPVPGSPFSSGGVEPNSIAVHNNLVYVSNAGNGGPGDYAGFYLSPWGGLIPITNSTVSIPAGSGPGVVLFNNNGTKLIGTLVNTSQINSFTVGWNGRLTAAPGSPFAGQGLGAFGSAFSTTNPSQLFVSNPHNGAGLGTVSAFNDSFNGVLTSIGASPFADQQTAPCWVAVTPDGRYLYAVNTASGTVSEYTIGFDGSLTLIGSTTVSSAGGVGATDATVSADGRDLYVNESAAHTVASFSINNGQLTELTSSPTALPAGITAAAGITSNYLPRINGVG